MLYINQNTAANDFQQTSIFRATLLLFFLITTFVEAWNEASTPAIRSALEKRQNDIMDQLRRNLRIKATTQPDMVNYVIKRFEENLEDISTQNSDGGITTHVKKFEMEFMKHRVEVEKVYAKAAELLREKFPQDAPLVDFIVTSLRDEKIVEKAYSEVNFNDFILSNIVRFETEFRNQKSEQDEATRNRTIIEAAYNTIRRKLDDRKPSAPEFNRDFVKFLKLQEAHEGEHFFGILLDSSSFDQFINRYLLQFMQANESTFLTGIYHQIRHLLMADYSYDFDTSTNILETIVTATPHFSPELIYDINRLKMRIYPYVTQYKYAKFDKLENSLDSWYPLMKKYNRRFLFYLKSKNSLNIKDVEDMSVSKNKFMLKAQSYFSDFNSFYQADIKNEIIERIRVILNEDFRNHQSVHNAVIKELESDHMMTDTLKVDLLYDLDKLRRIIKPAIRRIIMKLDEME